MRKVLKVTGYILLLLLLPPLVMGILSRVSTYLARQEGSINAPFSSYAVSGDYYENVIAILTDRGFTDISTIVDNQHRYSRSYGEVIEVSINGETRFYTDDYFMPNDEVRITYYGQP